MRQLLDAIAGMGCGLLALVLLAVFIGVVCGLGVWSCDVVRGLMP